MPSIHSLLLQLKADYPSLSFKPATEFFWSPSEKTVYYNEKADDQWVTLIHELAHGVLNHSEYRKDVQLLHMERQAWSKAEDIAKAYGEEISEETIETHLDSYRDWLHKRSTCPNCEAIGIQIKQQLYSCPACLNQWRVNEARTCGLRRYSQPYKKAL